MRIEPFEVRIEEAVLADLRARIAATRWPDSAPGEPWSQGTDLDYLRDLLKHWADRFDWRSREAELNQLAHYHAELNGTVVHFVQVRAPGGDGVPLILTHGWPSSFLELLPLVPYLTEPRAHGLDGPAFDLVIPSLPGYGFSTRPPRTGVNYRYVAGLWHELMTGLGYHRFGAQGGDFGAGVATVMALDHPERVIGLYLSNLEFDPPGQDALSDAERRYLVAQARWDEVERGYSSIQSTRPQTVGYGLNDSPAGLAAWLLEKWRLWTDSEGDLDSTVGRDFLLTMLTVYWSTQTITPSMRDYYDNRWHGIGFGPGDRVRVPTAYGGFDHQFADEGKPPREWVERLYDLHRFTPMPRGGHFAPVEQPELLARDLVAFFAGLVQE